MKKYFFPLFFIVFFLVILTASNTHKIYFNSLYQCQASIFTFFNLKPASRPIVVLDAGHGGSDPGKVGVNDVLEKDINLSIVKKLKYYLEKNHITVILTRDEDVGLSTPGISSPKVSDLQARKNIVLSQKPMAFLSIHQNSFSQESSRGAQVFYSPDYSESKNLAQILQSKLLKMDTKNHRQCKANADYFLLRDNPYPSVIVECGFLSNREEADLLNTAEYQKRIAWYLCSAVLEYAKTVS